jgi:asparagine synthase (glutamine-hydrolysing)
MGRLTYRRELADKLPPDPVAPALEEEAALALAAYRHWGAKGLARLEGSFALAVWDGERQLLLGGRDPFGGFPLFWTSYRHGLALGTCLQPLLQLLPRRCLDLDYLAEYLALRGAMFQEVATSRAAYEGIHRVSPGSIVQVRASDKQVQEQPYWNWLERIDDPGTDRLEELADLVAHRLRRAVGEHLRGRVASHVSGGMDSTTVALLARDGLRGQPGQPPVHAVSVVFNELGGLSRETAYLESALGQPGLAAHRLPGDNLLDYDCFGDPPPHDEPFGSLARMGVQAKLVEAAGDVGANTLLTGLGADGLLDQQPFHLAQLVGRGRLRSAWRDARAWGRATNRSAWYFLRQFGLDPWQPVAWKAGLRPLWRGGHADWQGQGPGTIAPWIQPAFARARALRERALRQLRPPCPPGNVAEIVAMLRACVGDCTSWCAAAPRGVAYIHPFLDPRLVSLCLGIQRRFRQQPGTQKPLLAQAMRDVLPEPIRNRRSKGHYNSLVHSGLTRHLSALEDLVRRAPVDALGVFNKDVLIRCLQQAALGSVPGTAMDKLNLTLAWLRWYSLQDEWQRPLTPAAIVRADGTPARASVGHPC